MSTRIIDPPHNGHWPDPDGTCPDDWRERNEWQRECQRQTEQDYHDGQLWRLLRHE